MKSIILSYLESEKLPNELKIDDQDVYHHLARVIRLKKNEEIKILNGKGLVALAVAQEIDKKYIFLKIMSSRKEDDLRAAVLLIGCPKKENFEIILKTAIECNIKKIIPVETEYSFDIVKENIGSFVNGEFECSARTIRVMESAMIQSNNPFYLTVEAPRCLAEIPSLGLNVLAWIEPNELCYGVKFRNTKHNAIFVGPEGGFSESERKFILDSLSWCSFEMPILRADTCVTYGLGFLNGLCYNNK